MAVANAMNDRANAETAAITRLPVSEFNISLPFRLSRKLRNQAIRPAGVAGMIAVAMKTAEMARADTAAKNRLLVSLDTNIVTQFPYLISPKGQSLRIHNEMHIACQFYLFPFFQIFILTSKMNDPFIDPKGWEFSPIISIADILIIVMAKFAHHD